MGTLVRKAARPRRCAKRAPNLASGLILAGALKIYATFGPLLISPSWLWLAGAFAVAIGLPISIGRYHRRRKQVFILVSAFAQKHWVNKLLHEFIMVTDASRVEADLVTFGRSAKYPIVFLDQRPFTDTAHYPRGSAFVGCDPAEIGTNAADWVARTLRRRRIRRPGVLVVGSNEHKDRQASFVIALKQQVPGAVITVSDQGLFARERCKEIVDRHLKDLSARGEQLHVIFCTNDDMALGAVDAIQERITTGQECDDITVVGVDGTDEALAVIRSGGTAFRATIVQDTRRVADLAVQQMLKLQAGEHVEIESFVPTTIYPLAIE